MWLSEGFATYFALLYQEFQDGHDAFLDAVKRSKQQAIDYALANPESTIVHKNLADFSKVIANQRQIYQGGAQVLQNIRGVLGTDTFWEGIRLYYSRFQNGSATTDDLRQAMQDACVSAASHCPADGKDLGWLFHELLNRGGVLEVEGSWRYDPSAQKLSVRLEQTQTSGLYRMPIELAITSIEPAQENGSGGGGGNRGPSATLEAVRRIHILEFDQKHQDFLLSLDREPVRVELDPDAWIMMKAKFENK